MTPVSVPENLVKFKDAVVSRIKIMARLNISEKRRPQDGRIAFTSKSGEEIDIRVSSLPTLYGESVSLSSQPEVAARHDRRPRLSSRRRGENRPPTFAAARDNPRHGADGLG